MERKEQTGHICRWMALGIMTAIVIVGCTIVIGLFEWRDRKEIESRNQELHYWQRDVHELNMHISLPSCHCWVRPLQTGIQRM